MTAPAAEDAASASNADVKVIGILEFAGLHKCPKDAPTECTYCGCAPGRCQRENG